MPKPKLFILFVFFLYFQFHRLESLVEHFVKYDGTKIKAFTMGHGLKTIQSYGVILILVNDPSLHEIKDWDSFLRRTSFNKKEKESIDAICSERFGRRFVTFDVDTRDQNDQIMQMSKLIACLQDVDRLPKMPEKRKKFEERQRKTWSKHSYLREDIRRYISLLQQALEKAGPTLSENGLLTIEKTSLDLQRSLYQVKPNIKGNERFDELLGCVDHVVKSIQEQKKTAKDGDIFNAKATDSYLLRVHSNIRALERDLFVANTNSVEADIKQFITGEKKGFFRRFTLSSKK